MTDLVLDFFYNLIMTVLDALPTITPPAWLAADGPIGTVMTYAGQMGAWFPASLAVTVLLAVLAFWLVAFTIKLVRIVASFLTLGGGSAA